MQIIYDQKELNKYQMDLTNTKKRSKILENHFKSNNLDLKETYYSHNDFINVYPRNHEYDEYRMDFRLNTPNLKMVGPNSIKKVTYMCNVSNIDTYIKMKIFLLKDDYYIVQIYHNDRYSLLNNVRYCILIDDIYEMDIILNIIKEKIEYSFMENKNVDEYIDIHTISQEKLEKISYQTFS